METKNNPKLESIMIPRNIIIESNNSTSKRSEISHSSNKDKDENVKQKPNNSSWNTVLSNTIELDIGDEVSISSASINQIGSGENNIEFLGNITDSELVDNKMRVNMSSYVSNELKFNLPLPLSTTVFTENNENFLSTYQPDYMNIDLSNLANFLAAYPSNNLENLEFIAGKLYKPNGEKLYLGKRDWSGLYKDEYSLTPATGFPEIKLSSDYGVHTNSIDINLNVGLESPENIAQNMTDSFHKPLVVNSSNTNKYINPVSIIQADIIDRDSIVVRNRKLFQENSYIAVSNTTSRGLYLEKDRGVKCDFLFDGSLAYDVTIFNKLFFENMLSGDPDRTYCMKKFQDLRKSDSFPDVQYHGTPSEDPVFYSGPNDAFDYFKTDYNTGNIGNIGHNIVVADRLNVNTDRSFIKYNYNLEVELQTQKLEESDIIMTNLLNTEENILLLKDVLHKIEYPVQDSSYPADIVDFSNKLFTNTLVSDLSFAMTDESLTDYNKAFENNLECYGRLIPHTRSRKEPTVDIVTTLTLPNSYLLNQPRENIRNDYNANYDLRYLISDDYLLQESFSSLNNSTAGRNKDWGYNVGIHSRFDSERVNNLPTASLFELNDYNKDLFETHDVGLVSGNRKELLPNLSNDKQVSYVVDIGVASNNSKINGRTFQDAPLPANNVVAGNYILIQNNSTQNVQGQFTIYLSDSTDESGTYSIIGLDSYLLNDNGPKITDKNYIKQVLYCDPKYVGHFVRIDFLFNSRLPLRLKINTGTNTIFDQNIGPSFLYKYSLPNRIFYLGTNEDISLSNELSLTFNLLPFKKYQFMLLDNSYTGVFDQGVFDEDGNLIHLIETSVRDTGRTIFVRMRADDLSTSIMYLHMRVGGAGVVKRLKLIIPLVTSDIYRYEQASLKEKSFLGFTVKKKFNIDIPKTSLFESFGVSGSLNDNQLAFPLSIQKQTFSTATNGTTFYDPSTISTAYETALMIGSNKLAVDYNETSRRFLFNYLHQPKTTGQDILFNFNSCKELTGTTPIPEFSATPAQEILSIYQEENVFAEDNVDNRNILFGLGIQAPKSSKWSTGPVNVKTKDFNIWYEADDLSRTLSFNTSDGASDDVKTLTYDNGSAISLERFELYPEFPSGTVNSDGVNNYGFPVNNTSSNRFPFIIRLEASNDNVQYDTLLSYTAKTPLNQSPVANANRIRIPHATSTSLPSNFHTCQRIETNTKKAYQYWGFNILPNPANQTGSSLDIAVNTIFSISKIIAYKKVVVPVLSDRYIASTGIISSQCGSAIQSIEIPDINNTYKLVINTNTPLYENTLLDKMGFNILSLLPIFGRVDNFFENTAQNSNSKIDSPGYLMREFLVKPFTTNARVDRAVIQALVRNAYIMPVFNIGIPSFGTPASTNATADSLYASSLPDSFSFPYLVIYSNIIPTDNDFYGGPEVSPINVFALVNRSYSSGNYIFLQGTDISYVVQKKQIINNFDIQIKLPDGTPLELSTNSSVIFRINKKKEIFIQN